MSSGLSVNSKADLITKFGKDKDDTGSSQVQVALLSKRIVSLSGHCVNNKHDYQAYRGLLMLIGKRRRLLKYLSLKNPELYALLTAELKIRK